MIRARRSPAREAGEGRPPARAVAAVGSSFPLVVSRTRRDLLALLGILVLTAITTGLAVAVPAEIGATLDAAAREAVEQAGSEADLLVRSSVADVSSFETTTAERLLAFASELPDRLPPALAEIAARVDTGIIGPEMAAQGPAGQVNVRVGVLDPSAMPELQVVAGSLTSPESSGVSDANHPSLEVAVSAAAAAAAGLSVGDSLSVTGAARDDRLNMHIAAIITPTDASSRRWFDLPGIWNPRPATRGADSSEVSFTALTGAATFDRVAKLFPDASVGVIRTSFDPSLFDLNRYGSARIAIDALETSTASIDQGALFIVVASSGYEKALRQFPATVAATTVTLSMIAAGMLGVAVFVSVLCYTALARRRRSEIALLRSRGASLGLIGVHAAVESVLVTVIGTALGIAAAAVAGAPGGWSILVVAIMIPIASAPVVSTVRPLLPATSPTRAVTARYTAVAALVAVAVTAVFALRFGTSAGGAGIDPLALVAPALCATVVALCLAPLPAVMARPMLSLATRTRSTGALLFASSAQDGRSLLALGAVILASSGAFTSVVLMQSISSSQQAEAWLAVGADVRVDEMPDAPALVDDFQAAGAKAAAVAQLHSIGAHGEASSISVTVLAIDVDYATLITALPADNPQRISIDDLARLTAVDAAGEAASPDEPLPVIVDVRMADAMGSDRFTLEVGDVSVPVVVRAAPTVGPPYVDEPVAIVDRARLVAYLAAAGGDGPITAETVAHPTTALAIGPEIPRVVAAEVAEAAHPQVRVLLRDEVIAHARTRAVASGITTLALQSLVAAAVLAALAVVVTAVLGVRRRGRTVALLGAIGVPRGAGTALALGELAPLVIGGVLGGAITAAVVVFATGPAFGVDSVTGGAILTVPMWLPAAVVATGGAILGVAVAIDRPLSRRIGTTDILRTGEES